MNIKTIYKHDNHCGHWEIYVDNVLYSIVPDSELSQELAKIRNSFCE